MLSIFWGVTKDCYYYIDREFMEEFKVYSCHNYKLKAKLDKSGIVSGVLKTINNNKNEI